MSKRIVKDEFTFVTNNRFDFSQLFDKLELHAGLIVLVPNVVPVLQRVLFEAAIRYVADKNLLNAVIEVTLERKAVLCVEYSLPAG